MQEQKIGDSNFSVSYCPERGGIITSIVLGQREVLYLDRATFEDPTVHVKGGIPLMFPNAGSMPANCNRAPELSHLPQHGFARDSANWTATVDDCEGGSFTQVLRENAETKRVYPYNFELSYGATLRQNGTCTVRVAQKNRESTLSMPVAMGLHPYFPVPHRAKRDITFDFPYGNLLKGTCDQWSNGQSVSIANPAIDTEGAILHIQVPDLGTLHLKASRIFERIWIWSPPRMNCFCVEPVMRDKGGIVSDPYLVPPCRSAIGNINIALTPE